MCAQKPVGTVAFLIIGVLLGAFLSSCGPMDSLFTSSGNYKINIQINDVPLDECSFARSSDRLRPYFEDSVKNDPDVTALMVYLRDSSGEIVGWRVIYQLNEEADNDNKETDIDENKTSTENKNDIADKNDKEPAENDIDDSGDESKEPDSDPKKNIDTKETSVTIETFQIPEQYANGDELVIPVKSLDNLPAFPIPPNLPMGRYTIVSNVMNEKDVLQRIEKSFFYLSKTDFAYDGINVFLPGIAESNQLIPRGTVIMLEADLKYANLLDPYIEWYNGRRKIAEGKISDGMGQLFWKAPEESGFFSIRAVIYPIENFQGLSGYQKEISLLVSSKHIDIHLVLEDIPQLMNWYILEANLNDSKIPAAAEQSASDRALKHSRGAPVWRASNGTYGVVTGNNNIISLPKVSISDNEKSDWQVLFRVKPENDGGIFSVSFGRQNNIFMHFNIEGSNLVLTLTSPAGTVSQTYSLNVSSGEDFASMISVNANLSAEADILPPDFEIENKFIIESEAGIPAADNSALGSSQVISWDGSFLTVGIIFSIQPGFLSAQLIILGDYIDSELLGNSLTIEAEIKNEFQIMLGFLQENKVSASLFADDSNEQSAAIRHEFTALWDEFALYRTQRSEVIPVSARRQTGEENRITSGQTAAIVNSPRS